MAFATLADNDVVTAYLHVPRTGAWRADVLLGDVDVSALSGRLTLSLDDGASLWVGTPIRPPENAFGRVALRLVGGAGGLAKALPGQSYTNTPASVPVKDALAGAGETLSPAADAGLLGTVLEAWSRLAGPASRQLWDVADEVSGTWRMLADGTLWFGAETWPPAFDYDLLDSRPPLGRWTLGATTGYQLLPGTTFEGKRVEYVTHAITSERLRTTVEFA
jgi:hypothetical protein